MEQRFELDVSASRPVLRLDHLFPGCTALIDTGALFPVWTKNRDLLEALGAKICKRNVLFSGFGGNVFLCKQRGIFFFYSECRQFQASVVYPKRSYFRGNMQLR